MAYDYVKRTYNVSPVVGGLVFHKVTKKYGNVADEELSQGHYVQVRFKGTDFAVPCHPTELEYLLRMPPTKPGEQANATQ